MVDVANFYKIPLKSVDGKENFLKEFEGKVTLVINVTGACGNAPQYGVIEGIYQKYKNDGFEVLAVPTNDYCGEGLTYGEHVYGCENAAGAKKFAEEEYKVTYKFSELVESNPGPEDIIPGLPSKYEKVKPHSIYKWLSQKCKEKNLVGGIYMHGNFEKYLIDKNGNLVDHFCNGALLDQNFENRKRGLTKDGADSAEVEMKKICAEIEKQLNK